jgi:hypothetical protein
MSKKVIYVDFKTASKKLRHNNIHTNKESSFISEKKSFTQKILEKFKRILSIFKINKKYNSNVSRRKHWM